jgi:hypothetical protein
MATLTVGDITPRARYTAASGQTIFAYAFPIFADGDLKVFIGSTLQTLTTHYSVSGAATSSGGNVTLVTGATTGDIVTIYRDLPVSRTSDYQTSGDLLAETLNDDFDKTVMMAQQNEANLSLGLRVSQFDEYSDMTLPSKANRIGRVLAFNTTTGNPEQGPTVVDTQSVADNMGDINTIAADLNLTVSTVETVSSNLTGASSVDATAISLELLSTSAPYSSTHTAVWQWLQSKAPDGLHRRDVKGTLETPKQPWNSVTTYNAHQMVSYGLASDGYVQWWDSRKLSTGITPNQTDISTLTAWVSGAASYTIGDKVSNDSKMWTCVLTTTPSTIEPNGTNYAYWEEGVDDWIHHEVLSGAVQYAKLIMHAVGQTPYLEFDERFTYPILADSSLSSVHTGTGGTLKVTNNSLGKINEVSDNLADISTLADATVLYNIQTVSGDLNLGVSSKTKVVSDDITNVNLVGSSIADVNTVAESVYKGKVETVATDLDLGASSKTKIVSDNILSVQTVAANIDDVIKVADDLNEAISEIETAANDLNEAVSEIDTVATSITNVDLVGVDLAKGIGTNTSSDSSVLNALTNAGVATTQAVISTTQAGTSTAQAVISTAKAATATAQAVISTAQAVIATTKASDAATSYSNTLAIYGNTTDVASAVSSASTSASTATTQAANAASSATASASSATASASSATTSSSFATTLASLGYLANWGLITDSAGSTADYGSL